MLDDLFPLTIMVTLLLTILVWAWSEYSAGQVDRDTIDKNNADAKCPHGLWAWRTCRSCAEEFEAEVRAEKDAAQDLFHQGRKGETTESAPLPPPLPTSSAGAGSARHSRGRIWKRLKSIVKRTAP